MVRTGILVVIFAIVLLVTQSSYAAKGKSSGKDLKVLKEIDVPKELTANTSIASKYLIYLPEGYEKGKKKWPFVLFLHGAGERGDDIKKVGKNGPPMQVEKKGKKFPFILVSPQCKKDKWWNAKELMKLIEHLESELSIDKDRIYITGLSMGGFGTWGLITGYPDKFAAAVPICGGGDPKKVKAIKDLPIWVFHGAKDNTVKIEKSQVMVDALKKLKSDVKFTIYPEVGHNSWVKAYETEELYTWLLEQKK